MDPPARPLPELPPREGHDCGAERAAHRIVDLECLVYQVKYDDVPMVPWHHRLPITMAMNSHANPMGINVFGRIGRSPRGHRQPEG